MRPFFSYYGSKWTGAKHYGPPRHDLVIEPFAGSASYSTRWECRNVRLYDVSKDVCDLWSWLIGCSVDDIKRIPDRFEIYEEVLALPRGPQLLVRFWVSKGRAEPSGTLSPWYFQWRSATDCRVWGPAVKRRIIEQKPLIDGWSIEQKAWWEIDVVPAHWHVDPPYNNHAGSRYPNSDLSYSSLAAWCRGLPGHVDVCENVGADWLPFSPLYEVVTSRGRRSGANSREAVWRSDPTPINGLSEAGSMTHSHDTATPALSVESEYVLVPREPTHEMKEAGARHNGGLYPISLYRAMIAATPAPNPSPAAKGGEAVVVPYDDFHAAYGFVPRSKVSPDRCLKTRLRALLRAEDLAHADEAEALATHSPQPANAVREAECPDDPHEAYSKGWNDATEEYDAKGLDQVARMKLEKQVHLLVEGLEAETVARKKAEAERDALREQSARNAVQLAYSNNDRIDLARVRTELERADEALRWYAENVQGFGRPGSVGALYGGLLDADGGRRARDALAPHPAPAGEVVETARLRGFAK